MFRHFLVAMVVMADKVRLKVDKLAAKVDTIKIMVKDNLVDIKALLKLSKQHNHNHVKLKSDSIYNVL